MDYTPNAQLALDTILQKPTVGIPSNFINIMQHDQIERIADASPGDYLKYPEEVYLACQRAIGIGLLDQWIPRNPLTMGKNGFAADSEKRNTATTGAADIVCNGIHIDAPEAVVEHLERFIFPGLRMQLTAFNEDSRVKDIIEEENDIQSILGPSILKSGYGYIHFPTLAYTRYGYEHYFMAFALYPEVMETHFSLQADMALLNNKAAARAIQEGRLPCLFRLDHDMADSRDLLMKPQALDRIWFPHFARCLKPILKTDMRLLWHCDGNLMAMVPRLLDVGLHGFQGFQYEDGMDYERICGMKTKSGEDLIIMGGVSVTRTLPYGKPRDVKRELDWLVDSGPRTGLFLGASSSVTPGVPWENLRTFIEGLNYYREHGRKRNDAWHGWTTEKPVNS
jgi:hypothetical protein